MSPRVQVLLVLLALALHPMTSRARTPPCDKAAERRFAEQRAANEFTRKAYEDALEERGLKSLPLRPIPIRGPRPAESPGVIIAGAEPLAFAVDAEGNLYRIDAAPRVRSRARHVLCGCGPPRRGADLPDLILTYRLPPDRPFKGRWKVEYDARIVEIGWSGRMPNGRICPPPPSAPAR